MADRLKLKMKRISAGFNGNLGVSQKNVGRGILKRGIRR
jgi:hypothetical protein